MLAHFSSPSFLIHSINHCGGICLDLDLLTEVFQGLLGIELTYIDVSTNLNELNNNKGIFYEVQSERPTNGVKPIIFDIYIKAESRAALERMIKNIETRDSEASYGYMQGGLIPYQLRVEGALTFYSDDETDILSVDSTPEFLQCYLSTNIYSTYIHTSLHYDFGTVEGIYLYLTAVETGTVSTNGDWTIYVVDSGETALTTAQVVALEGNGNNGYATLSALLSESYLPHFFPSNWVAGKEFSQINLAGSIDMLANTRLGFMFIPSSQENQLKAYPFDAFDTAPQIVLYITPDAGLDIPFWLKVLDVQRYIGQQQYQAKIQIEARWTI